MSDLPAVSRTAIGVARARAAEAGRPDPLFDDPFAAAFVTAAGMDTGTADLGELTEEQRRWRAAIAFHISIRTRFFDDYLLAAVHSGIRQVVVLGAGLDTRAFRLEVPDPDVHWFELDLPDVLAFKQAVLEAEGAVPRGHRTPIAVDLAADWSAALQVAGFCLASPTAWLAEGLLVYLDRATAEHVLTAATALSAPGSRLAAERGELAAQLAATSGSERLDEASALWQGGLDDGVIAWLSAHGWHPTEYDVADVATSYGRQAPQSARSGFVTAAR
ncbi:MAG TPA: SAM-dependent methyltransferase [Mycobacteriales bacterium]|nr:SAM-dependent methyltransferase [Mycobacteriales bacterium]